MRYLLLFILPFLWKGSSELLSQSDDKFIPELKPISTDTAIALKSRLEEPAYEPDLDKRKSIKYYEELCEKQSDYFYKLCKNGYIVTEDTLISRINNIVKRIEENSPIAPKGYFKVFLSRDDLVNASSWGQGIIIMNVGLLARLKNDDEIAFVLGHEMGHDIMKHIKQRFEYSSMVMTDRKLKKEIKTAGRKETGYQDIFYRILSNKRLHSRMNEYQADSIGHKIVEQAGYDQKACTNALAMLKDADYFLYTDSLSYSEIFGSDLYQFNNRWLKNSNMNSYWERNDSMFIIPDDLKTHPNTEDRIKVLAERSNEDAGSRINQNKLPSEFTLISELSIIESLVYNEDHGLAIYKALQLKNKYPSHFYLDLVVVHSLYSIGHALKNQNFSNVVGFPDKSYPASYNQFLGFLHALNSKKLFTLVQVYYQKNVNDKGEGEYYDMISLLYEMSLNVEEDHSALIESFISKYPESKYDINHYKFSNL